MKIIKRIAIVLGSLLILLLAAAFILPIVFKDKIVALAKEQINANVNAVVDFEDVDLSLFRSFPNLSLAVHQFSVIGVEPFEGVPLITGESADLTLDLLSVLKSPIQLRKINLVRPDIRVYILRDGTANYNIAKATEETEADTTAGADFQIELRRYAITDGKLIYDDNSIDTYVQLDGVNHSGSGNFTRDLFDLVTQTTVDSLTVTYGGITYLDHARADLDAIFQIDQPNSKYTLKDNILTLNDLKVNGEGWVQLDGDNYNMDLHLQAPENDFKNLFSVIPNAYIEGYENVKASGQFRFVSDIKGTYNGDLEQYPSFRVDLGVDNASVKYPDLPLGISDINAKAQINSPSSDFDDLVVDVSEFRVRVGNNPFSARLHLETPISDPYVDAEAKGTINLRELQQAYPMDGMETLAGIIVADIEAQTRQSYIDQKAYDKVKLQGALKINDLKYKSEGLPLVVIDEAESVFSPQRVVISNFKAKLGRSDLQASGAIDNILAYISPKKTMTGQLAMRSRLFDVNEWYGNEEEAAVAVQDTTTAPTDGAPVFDRFNLKLDAKADEIVYADYRLLNTSAQGQIAPNRIDIANAYTKLGDSDFRLTGTIVNAFDYAFDDGVLQGNLKLTSNYIDLNQFMSAESEPAPAAAATEPAGEMTPIEVPDNINMTIDADISQVRYTNLTLRDLKGALRIADQAVMLENVQANALGGSMGLQGAYDTSDPENPGFQIKFDLNRLNFQESFNTLNTFRTLAPVGQFLNGAFTSSLIMEGTLGKDLMPRLSTLNAQGFLETINAVVNNFAPLQAIGQKLNVSELSNAWHLQDSRNWFEIKDGTVEVKPFDTKVADIPMNIGGRHGLDQQMDYNIQASIPREMLRKSGVGQFADSGIQLLEGQASKLGINFQQGEYINVLINLTGSIKQPKVGIKLLGTGGEQSIAESAKEQLQLEVGKQLEEGKAVLKEKSQEVIDSAKTLAGEKLESAKKQAEELLKEQAKDATKNLGEDAKKAAGEILDSTATKSAEDIKKELEKFNPFKKKKEDPKKKSGGG